MKTLNRINGRRSMIAFVAILAISVGQLSAGEPMKGPAYSLSDKSTLSWEGNKPGGGHNGVVDVVAGNIYTEQGEITGGSFTIDMSSIINYDLKNQGMNKRLVDHLKSDDFFYVEKYPNAQFTIFSVAEMEQKMMGDINATHMVSGDLKIKETTKRISFPAEIRIEGDRVYAKTSDIRLDRTKWDITTMSKSVFADLKDNFVDDEFIVRLDLQFDIN